MARSRADWPASKLGTSSAASAAKRTSPLCSRSPAAKRRCNRRRPRLRRLTQREDVGGHALDVQAIERAGPRGAAHGHAHVVAAREQRAHHVRADEPGRTGHQDPRHGREDRLPGMSGVAVVTDTTHYLPADVVARHELHMVSLYVNWDGRTDRESDLPDFDAFYDHMRTAASLPSTSPCSDTRATRDSHCCIIRMNAGAIVGSNSVPALSSM